MRLVRFGLLVICAILLGGCSVQSGAIKFGETSYAPKPKNTHVDVLLEPPEQPFEVIGLVTADKHATTTFGHVKEADLYPALIDEARNIGADAILDIRFETYEKNSIFSSKDKHGLRATANAIKYKKADTSNDT